MCGIAGLLQPNESAVATVKQMLKPIAHRGPDDSGAWCDQFVGLGHKRLAILDVTATAKQPMHLGHLSMVYNGEVYNFKELRSELIQRGHSFQGTGDTEVVLACIAEFGFEAAVRKFNGMFALAAWDATERVLHVARDRMGIKPLLYGFANGRFVFASELGAIESISSSLELNNPAAAAFLRHGYVPAPQTMWKGVYKLQPGHLLEVRPESIQQESASIRRYWNLPEPTDSNSTSNDFIDRLDREISLAVEKRLVSDVPVGAFLSGGIDSSLVTAMMQEHSKTPVRTFSIGFEDSKYDESSCAEAVAHHLGTVHTNLRFSESDILSMVPQLASIFDEPFGDTSQFPMRLVCELARNDVKVALSGDGGDELLGGYTTYLHSMKAWNSLSRIPVALRNKTISRALKSMTRFGSSKSRRRLEKICQLMPSRSLVDLHYRMTTNPIDTNLLQPRLWEPARSEHLLSPSRTSSVRDLQRADMQTYMVDDILTKVDRTSMSVGLEARVPLLDHNVVELAMSAPETQGFAGGAGKVALKEILYRRVPRELFDRPKRGFSIPISQWARGPLREWIGDTLSRENLRRCDFFNPSAVAEMQRRHLNESADYGQLIFNMCALQQWTISRSRATK